MAGQWIFAFFAFFGQRWRKISIYFMFLHNFKKIKKSGTCHENVMSPGLDGSGSGIDQFDRHITIKAYTLFHVRMEVEISRLNDSFPF